MHQVQHLRGEPNESPTAPMTYNASNDCVEFGVTASIIHTFRYFCSIKIVIY